MTFNVAGLQTYTLKSSISSTQTTILLSSFKVPVSGDDVTMALLNTSIVYGTIDPKTANAEFISFTGITQNTDGTAELTGVVRGLNKTYPFTEDVNFKLPHSGAAQFIISNPPQIYNKYGPLENDNTFTGTNTFTGVVKIPTYTSSDEDQAASIEYVNDVAIAGAPDASSTVKGISKLSVNPVSPTNPIAVGDNDTRLPTQDENDALAGTSGTPSSTNKYVTNDQIYTDGISTSQLTSNASIGFGQTDATGNNNKIYQSFVAGKDTIQSIILKKETSTSTPASDISLKIFADSAGNPTGSALATSTIAVATYNAITDDTEFESILSSVLSVTQGATYWVELSQATPSDTNYPNLHYQNTAVTGFTLKKWNTTDGYVAVTGALYLKVMESYANKLALFSVTIPNYFGDGSDGDVVMSSNTNLTRDMYYNNLTINSGVTLNKNGFEVFILNTLSGGGSIVDTSVNNAGGAGGPGGPVYAYYGGSAGGNGNSYIDNFFVLVKGGSGGSGGDASGGVGGVGGVGGISPSNKKTITSDNDILYSLFFVTNNMFSRLYKNLGKYLIGNSGGGGGSGAGSGGGNGFGGNGGGGGAGGNGFCLFVNNYNFSGVLSAPGGNGSAGATGTSNYGQQCGGGGGGAGGNGGNIIVIYKTKQQNINTNTSGGSGGSGASGSSGGSNGANGPIGTAGSVYQIQIT